MATRAIICGSGLAGSGLFEGLEEVSVTTRCGAATVLRSGDCIMLPRHGYRSFTAPHLINYRANIAALAELGACSIFTVNSVGSLKEDIAPGTLVVPHDVFCPWRRDTFQTADPVKFTVPVVDAGLRATLVKLVMDQGCPVVDGGVYCQTLGPSFETRAEIAFLATVGHLVGMTFAQEVFLATELDIPVAALCMVDNFAHGIGPEQLTMSSFASTVAKNRSTVESLVHALMQLEACQQ